MNRTRGDNDLPQDNKATKVSHDAASGFMAFRLASNILDMALAAAEAGEGLEDSSEAKIAIRGFFDHVGRNLGFQTEEGQLPARDMRPRARDGNAWAIRHSNYLLRAEACHRLLLENLPADTKPAIREHVIRLASRIEDGRKLEGVVAQ